MKRKLYLEPSIISYLTAQPSRDLITAARQEITRAWWQTKRGHYELYISEFVLEEIGAGDPGAAALRLAAVEGLPEVEVSRATIRLAEDLVTSGVLPAKASLDAFHLASAVGAGLNYLLTWNFKHLASATIRSRLESACRAFGYEPCIICTPEELLEE